jgi:PPOX class probable F420-dependent enzyme
MTDFPLSHRDLLDAPVGILSTIGRSGIPQTTAIWFLYDEGELYSWLSDARVKVKNLLERPEFSFFILDTANTQRYLVVRGRAELTPDPDFVYGERLGQKYGQDLHRLLREGEIRYKVTFAPLSVDVR